MLKYIDYVCACVCVCAVYSYDYDILFLFRKPMETIVCNVDAKLYIISIQCNIHWEHR